MGRWTVVVGVVVILLGFYSAVEGYPIGDLTLDGLLNGSHVLTLSRRRRALSRASGCDYPGAVAVTVAGRVLYTALYQEGSIRVPSDALEILKLSNKFNELKIYGDDGSGQASIAQNTLEDRTERNADGTSTLTLSTDFTSTRCPSNDAIFYDSATMTVDVSTCKTASYGGTQISIHSFNGVLQTDTLAANLMRGCCADVLPNILGKVPNLGHPTASVVASSFTCVKSGEGICNGDIGSPIYCTDNRSGQQVVVGMVDSGTCHKGEYFAAIDFTRGTLPGFSR